MSEIVGVQGREILDSRGNPTIEVDIMLESGVVGQAAVPSGASKGSREALELRDKNSKRFLGKGVLKAVENVNTIIGPEILGLDVTDQAMIDHTMIALDGTANKSKLGANSILGVSLAAAHAAAEEVGLPLFQYIGGTNAREMPVPMMNILNGGVHADNNVEIQEFMIMPVGADSFSSSIRMGAEIFHHLKSILKKKNYSTAIGDEGGFAPDLKSNQEALDILVEAIQKAGFKPGKNVVLALDVAASELFANGKYIISTGKKSKLTSEGMIEYLLELVNKYPIVSIEDGLAENDWNGWQKLTKKLGDNIQIVGDDIFTTNTKILSKGIKKCIANSILIKVNQIGTLSETLETVEMAKRAGYTAVISHRSAETEDTTIADISVGVNAGQIKTGSLCRSDRTAKYNQLLRIEEILGETAIFNGNGVFYNLL